VPCRVFDRGEAWLVSSSFFFDVGPLHLFKLPDPVVCFILLDLCFEFSGELLGEWDVLGLVGELATFE
jgi:hypothetical protein